MSIKKLFKNIKYLFKYSIKEIFNNCNSREFVLDYFYLSNPIKILNPNETIDFIINNKVSICRFGDGEFQLCTGNSIPFQDYNLLIEKKLIEILTSNINNINVCINYLYFYKPENIKVTGKEFLKNYIPNNLYKIFKFLNKEKLYLDAGFTQAFQVYDNYNFDEYFDKIQNIWRNKDITIICGETVFNKIQYNIFDSSKSIEYIYAPSKNAFEKYNEILNTAKNIDKDRLIIIILGPTATILAYDLANLGYQALDLGHIAKDYDYFKKILYIIKKLLMNFFNQIKNNINNNHDKIFRFI